MKFGLGSLDLVWVRQIWTSLTNAPRGVVQVADGEMAQVVGGEMFGVEKIQYMKKKKKKTTFLFGKFGLLRAFQDLKCLELSLKLIV